MRVLFFTNSFPPDYTGGAEVSAYHTMRGLMRRGVACSLLTANYLGRRKVDEWYELDGIPVHRVRFTTKWPGSELFDLRIFQAVRREIASFRPDVVHIHNVSGASLAPHLACRMAGAPVVNTIHDLWLLCPNNMRMQEDGSFCDPAKYPDGCGRCFRGNDYWAAVPGRKRLFQRITDNALLVSPSRAFARQHVAAGYAPGRFRQVYNAIAESAPGQPIHPGVARILATAGQTPTVVYAGGGVANKGAHLVADAAPRLLEQIPGLRIVVAGGGYPDIMSRFHNLAPGVQVLGKVPFTDMRLLFGAADLALLPSIWFENSPIVIYESHQVGTPVVGTAIGGIPELIEDGLTGYLFPRGDAAAMAGRILHHFARPADERRRMRLACVQSARSRLSLEAHLDSILEVYGEAVGCTAQRRGAE